MARSPRGGGSRRHTDFDRLDDMRARLQNVGLSAGEVAASRASIGEAVLHVLVILPRGQHGTGAATEPETYLGVRSLQESLDTLEEEAAGERRVLKKARLSQMSGALHASEVSVPLDTIRAFQEVCAGLSSTIWRRRCLLLCGPPQFVKTSLALGVMDSIETGSELADVTCFFFHARSLDVADKETFWLQLRKALDWHRSANGSLPKPT